MALILLLPLFQNQKKAGISKPSSTGLQYEEKAGCLETLKPIAEHSSASPAASLLCWWPERTVGTPGNMGKALSDVLQ